MNKLEDFIQRTQYLRKQVGELLDLYNRMGKGYFGSDWVDTSSVADVMRVMIDVNKLIEFEPDPPDAMDDNNALVYDFSTDLYDFFKGKTKGVNVIEVMPISISPVSSHDRQFTS